MTDIYGDVEPFYASAPMDVAESARSRSAVLHQNGLSLRISGGTPVEPEDSLRRRVELAAKRALLDVPLSFLALVLLAPLLLAIAVAIRVTSPGPALFRQDRVGLNGRIFKLIKFRTMRLDDCDDSGHAQVTANDDRVTPLGKFLRASSLDELPQLWNILIGDMAVIGPRPMVPGMKAAGVDYRQAVTYYDFRHRMRPGLSGWAQAHGLRGPTRDLAAARQRVDHDCAYVQNFSIWLDIRTIWITIRREFLTGSGL